MSRRIPVPTDAPPRTRQAFNALTAKTEPFDTSATTTDYTLLASGSATSANNNEVLAALINELIAKGVISGTT